MNRKHQSFLDGLAKLGKPVISRAELIAYCAEQGINVPQWYTGGVEYRAGRGLYKVPNSVACEQPEPVAVDMVAQVVPMAPVLKKHSIASVETGVAMQSCVPPRYENYVPFGPFAKLKSVIASRQFFPVFITGPSGNGKSMSVEQACAQANREFVAVSMTDESDEGDLLGNYVLIEGTMVWRDGPVTVAARKGAVLLIDEIDYGSKNLSCLQRVLEGKPFLLKKKNEMVVPAPGFNVIATANTKGQGSDSGKYMFTNVLNEAFLERFPITIEQPWPTKAVESKILTGELAAMNVANPDLVFVTDLVNWADVIRRTHEEGGVEDVVSTRRLVHIIKAWAILGDKTDAIDRCLSRFDSETKLSFIDLFDKVSRGEMNDAAAAEPSAEVPESL